MFRVESVEDKKFRIEVRKWLTENLDTSIAYSTFRLPPEQSMRWYRTLSEKGWIAPHWPKEYGGMDASPVRQVIMMEEFARAGAPDLPGQGLYHIGPLLMVAGTRDQKKKHLPAILRGDEVWCQGYSEPEAGSDLASLKTEGRITGDRVIVTGRKIWTTWGHHADWMFALVRTEKGSKRNRGISFILMNLKSPGITIRSIENIAGDHEFAEVTFDSVEIPIANVVGDINDGWRVATKLLGGERLNIGSPLQPLRAYQRLLMMVISATDRPMDSSVRELLCLARTKVEMVTASYLKIAEGHTMRGGVEASVLKIIASTATQEILDLSRKLSGEMGILREAERLNDDLLDYSEMYLQARRLSIYGGSNEIQLGLIAKQGLDLGLGNSKTIQT